MPLLVLCALVCRQISPIKYEPVRNASLLFPSCYFVTFRVISWIALLVLRRETIREITLSNSHEASNDNDESRRDEMFIVSELDRSCRSSAGTVSTTCGSGWVVLSSSRPSRDRDPPATAGGADSLDLLSLS